MLPEQPAATATTTPVTGATEPGAQTPPAVTADDLKAQIAKLEAAVKDANKEAEKRRKRLEELEKAETDRQAAQLSETEKLQKKLSEAERKAIQLEEEVGRMRLRSAVERAAALPTDKHGGFQDPSDAYMLADLAAVTAGEDGTYKGIQEALETLAKAKPHLVKAAATTTTTVAGVPASPKPVTPQKVTQPEDDRRKAQVGQDIRQRF